MGTVSLYDHRLLCFFVAKRPIPYPNLHTIKHVDLRQIVSLSELFQ
jgi:hypothetical protein